MNRKQPAAKLPGAHNLAASLARAIRKASGGEMTLSRTRTGMLVLRKVKR